MRKAKPALPLFPDLLEQNDPFGRAADYLRSGHGVWTFFDGSTHRRRSENCTEQRHLMVIYSDERRWRFKEDWTGKCWSVEIAHYFNTWHQPANTLYHALLCDARRSHRVVRTAAGCLRASESAAGRAGARTDRRRGRHSRRY